MCVKSYLVDPAGRGLAGQKRQRVEDDVSVFALGLCGVEDCPIAVHQGHSGREVEYAGGQDEGVVGEVVRFTYLYVHVFPVYVTLIITQ